MAAIRVLTAPTSRQTAPRWPASGVSGHARRQLVGVPRRDDPLLALLELLPRRDIAACIIFGSCLRVSFSLTPTLKRMSYRLIAHRTLRIAETLERECALVQ